MNQGPDQLARLLDATRQSADGRLSPEEWYGTVRSELADPEDESPSRMWDRLNRAADQYRRSSGRERVWELVEVLYELCGWYLDRPVRVIHGIGTKRARQLTRLDIETVGQLARHYPRSYTDRRFVDDIRDLDEQDRAAVLGEVVATGVVRGRRPRFEVRLGDDTGVLQINFWNQTYLSDQIHRGNTLFCFGKVETFRGTPQMNNPEFERIETEDDLEASRTIQPIYSLTEGISQNRMRTWVDSALERVRPMLVDCLPRTLRQRRDLRPYVWSLHQVHHPDSVPDLEKARRRLIYEEFFFYHLLFALESWQVDQVSKPRCYPERSLVDRFLDSIPFSLTPDQDRALQEIERDLDGDHPMHRLLQGDVGTGKTVVATASLLRVAGNGYQTAIMAPTEVLAEQHYLTLRRQLAPLDCEIELLIGSASPARKDEVRSRIETGSVDLVVGTQALIQETVDFSRLGYVVIDEQHRFGVEQRRRLRDKGPEVDMLIMSATPIPRSMALTIYGDLEVSTLESFPGGPRRIETRLRDQTRAQRMEVYRRVRERVSRGEQAFFVFPAVEEGNETDLTAAEEAYEQARSSDFFGGLDLGLLHGRMNREQKQAVMKRFREGQIDVLFSTTVIEVGIDVPDASCLVVHDAEQFGLAQLHQLRGRVGRGGQEACCELLVSPEASEDSRRRLDVLENTLDGFEVSRADLRQRGIGDMAGTRQSGRDPFQLGNVWEHRELLKHTRRDARSVVEESRGLTRPEYVLTRKKLNQLYGERREYVRVG